MPKKPFFTFAFVGWLAFITFSSLASFSGIDTGSLNIPYGDKLVHFAFYFIAAVLGVFFLREHEEWHLKSISAFVITLLFTIVFGIIIEVIQYHFTTYREGDVIDAIANSLGSFGGILATYYFFSKGGFMEWRKNG